MKKNLYVFAVLLCLAPSLATAAVSLAQPNTSALSQGLVGYWPLDGATTNWATGKTNDLSGQGNAATLISISTTSTPVAGRVGQAFKLNGGTSYLDAGSALDPNFQNHSFTISAWVLFRDTSNADMGIVTVGTTNSSDQLLHFIRRNDKLMLGFFADDLTGSQSLAAGKWYHVVATWNSATKARAVYINGVVDAAGVSSGFLNVPAASTVYIGRYNGGSYLPGSIDDVRIYNRPFTSQEVALLYAAGTTNIDRAPLPSASAFNFGLNAGLVGYWPLDGSSTNWRTNTTSDISGSGNTGTLVAMSTSTSPVAGKIGQAINFNGNTSYISTPNNVGITGASPRTISAWIRRTANCGALTCPIVWWGAQTSSQLSLLALAGNKLDFYGFAADTTGTATLAINTWYHVAATYDGASVRLYVNGVLDTGPTPKTLNTTNSAATIGYYSGWAAVFPGAIDDLRIFNRALSVQEIGQLYGVGTANIAHSNTTTGTGLNAGLVGYWTMDGGSINWRTNTIADQSGSGNAGTLLLMSTSSSPVAGKSGQALKFSGSNYITAADSSSLNLTGSFTVGFWMKANSWNDGGSAGIVSKKLNDSSNGYVIYDDGGFGTLINLRIKGTTAAQNSLFSNSPVTVGKWQHWVAVYDSSAQTAKWYLNGVLDKTYTSINVGDMTNTQLLNIGHSQTWNGYFNGTLDDMRFYNRALSAQEVKQLYLQGK